MSWDIGKGDVSCNFEDLLRESDSEDEYPEVETSEDELDEMQVYDEQEFLDDFEEYPNEYTGSEPTILGLYTAEGVEIPLRPSSSSLSAPMIIPSPLAASPLPPAASPVTTSSPDRGMQLLSPSRALRSSTPDLADDRADARDNVKVCVIVQEDDEDTYHLADEHQIYPPQVVRQESALRARGGRRTRGPRRGVRTRGARRGHGESQWTKGDRVVEVYMNDEDVPEELRESVMRVVRAREAARVRAAARVKRQRLENEEDDEFFDADVGQDEALFAGTGISSRFEWKPMHNYSGKREKFLPEKTGPVIASENAYEAFRQYWDDGILSHIANETNRYAQGIARSSASFAKDWYDTNFHEILILFSFWMMLGIIKMPSTKSCFTSNPLLQTNIFRKLFSRTRYFNLSRALHFNDNSKKPTDNSDRLFCCGPILDHLNSRFQEVYVPSQNICIDESLTLWKGNLKFRQYIKTKAAKLGIKTFELCESSTGYLWSFFVYTGTETAYHPAYPSTLLKSTSSVLKLVHPLLNKGYTLFLDNWFNSPCLARFLKAHKTDCAGTLRVNCNNIPALISLCQLKDGQIVARHAGDIVVMAYQDKARKICTISSYHGVQQDRMEPKPHRDSQYKPQVILDYNKGMGGVDRKDQMLEPYLLERKRCQKWNRKMFKRLLNCSILNSRIHLEASTATPKDHLVFRLELVDKILLNHHKFMPKRSIPTAAGVGAPRPGPSSAGASVFGLPETPAERHFAARIPTLNAKGVVCRRRCRLCGSNPATRDKRTSYWCSICGVPLCLEPCFARYHSERS